MIRWALLIVFALIVLGLGANGTVERIVSSVLTYKQRKESK
jgi:hypothetical protein